MKHGSPAQPRRPTEIAHPHLAHPGPAQVQRVGGAARQVDDAAVDEGAAVVDPQHHPPAVGQVGDLHQARQGQGLVGRGQGVHVEALAGGGRPAVKLVAVP